MTTYYTCTQVTPEMYEAYLKYKTSNNPFSLHEVQAVTLCCTNERITIYPVCGSLNARHLSEFGSTDPQSNNGESNVLVSLEEFFNQLFIFELEQ